MSLHYLKVIVCRLFYGSIYSVRCKVLSHSHSVATTETLNENCKVSLTLTLLTIARDNLGFSFC